MKRPFMLLAILLSFTLPGFSALIVTLDSPSQPGIPGGAVIYGGTIENTGPLDIFLNDISIGLSPPADTYLTADPNFFFANVPGVLLPGETYTGPIFRLLIAVGAPPAAFLGSASILGGEDEFADNALNSSDFDVQLTPEPSTVMLMGGAVAALAIRRRVTGR